MLYMLSRHSILISHNHSRKAASGGVFEGHLRAAAPDSNDKLLGAEQQKLVGRPCITQTWKH
ncbi:hypothetical protein E2C01_084890 [Portunus trituberculatus]|uniref:Uncharacterized protein n=1 Tax=Portunus trituberculatus TaxID=210409 RepID=A0A5B7J7F2_PORTR|nr:hypothetical protein [Portunus trituberculatus]